MGTLTQIEIIFGRRRTYRNAPRTLDLDLIAYGREVRRGGTDLILPHPRAIQRRFVMAPLAEIAPHWQDPVTGQRAVDLAKTAPVGSDARVWPPDA